MMQYRTKFAALLPRASKSIGLDILKYISIYIYIDISNFYVEAAYLSQWVVALHEELLAKDC